MLVICDSMLYVDFLKIFLSPYLMVVDVFIYLHN